MAFPSPSPSPGTRVDELTLQYLVERCSSGTDAEALMALDEALLRWPDDARLHFLRGSILAGVGRIDDAMWAMRRSLELDGEYSIARFQLGLLQYTSAMVDVARETWTELLAGPESDPLRLFVEGLEFLARDRFAEAIDYLSRGIAVNRAFPPLSRDMQMLIDRITPLVTSRQEEHAMDASTHLLLSEYASRTTKH